MNFFIRRRKLINLCWTLKIYVSLRLRHKFAYLQNIKQYIMMMKQKNANMFMLKPNNPFLIKSLRIYQILNYEIIESK